jgi:hypothetical protein
MELETARTLARTMMTEHGLPALGWKFAFDRAEKRLGLCTFTTKTISMGAAYVLAADEDAVSQTMLHEIAHALVGSRAGHGYLWQSKARNIGYLGKRTAENPHHAAKQTQALEDAKAAEAHAAAVTSGPLRPGERVTSVDGRHSGLLVSVAKVNCKFLNDRDDTVWSTRITNLLRANAQSAAPVPPNAVAVLVPLATTSPTRIRVGDRISSSLSSRSGVVTSVGRSRFHYTSDQDGKTWTVPFASARLLEPGAGVKAAAQTATAAALLVVPRFHVGDPVVLHQPSSKYHGLTGAVESVGPKNCKVRTNRGIITCPPQLLRAR